MGGCDRLSTVYRIRPFLMVLRGGTSRTINLYRGILSKAKALLDSKVLSRSYGNRRMGNTSILLREYINCT
jgi:hypothetical protein